ncbi:MAG: hypothetical protein AAGG07_09145 [Planctomycetota bacterium]
MSRAHRDRIVTGALWCSVGVLATLVGLMVHERTEPADAKAEMAVVTSGYSAMTTRVSNEELMTLIDQPAETLLVYRVVNQRRVDLVSHQRLPELFAAARASAEGN